MKIRSIIKELDFERDSGFRQGSGIGQFTSWNNKTYLPIDPNYKNPMSSEDGSKLDPYIEQQLINRAIDLLFSEYPNLVQDKKIRRHLVQMLVGKVTSGDGVDAISLKNMIKTLKKKGITVENSDMNLRNALSEFGAATIEIDVIDKASGHVKDTIRMAPHEKNGKEFIKYKNKEYVVKMGYFFKKPKHYIEV